MIYCQNRKELAFFFFSFRNAKSMSRFVFFHHRLVNTGEYNPSRYPFIATFSLNDRDGNGLKEEYFGISCERDVTRRSRR